MTSVTAADIMTGSEFPFGCPSLMRSSRSLPNVLIHWTSRLLVWGVAALLPHTAFATCGDYLVMHGHSLDHVASPMPDHAPQKPCHGAKCRQSTPQSPPATPFNFERSSEQGDATRGIDVTQTPAPQKFELPLSATAGDGHPQRIEHPPR